MLVYLTSIASLSFPLDAGAGLRLAWAASSGVKSALARIAEAPSLSGLVISSR
jgi:hypothetical protein